MKISKKKHVTKNGVVKKNPKKVNLYLKLNKKQSKEINNFPMFFAFDGEQLKEGLKKLGVTKNQVVSIGAGGFIRKSDVDKYRMLRIRHRAEHKKALENPNYVYQMFRYELSNHEYCVTGDYEDTLNAVGLTWKMVNNNPMWQKQLEKATDDYMKSVRGC